MWSNARISHYRHPSTGTCTMHMTGVGGRVWVVGGVTHVHGCMGAWVHGCMVSCLIMCMKHESLVGVLEAGGGHGRSGGAMGAGVGVCV